MKSLMPQIDSNDGLFHNGNPATGEQGTRVTDTWLNNLQDRVRDVQAEAHYVLQKAGFTPKAETQTQLYQAIVKIIDDNRKTASLTQKGETKLYTGYDSQSEDLALTPKTGYQLKQLIDSNTRALGNVIPNSKKSSAVNSNSADTVATSAAVKTANDNANGRVSKSGDTMTGDLSFKQGDYSGISFYNNDGYYLRLEGNPKAASNMLTFVYRQPNGGNVAVASLPKRDGTIAYVDQVVNKSGDTMTGQLNANSGVNTLARGADGFNHQWQNLTAPYLVDNGNANGNNAYYPFIKGINRNGNTWGTAFSFGYETPDGINKFGRGCIHLIEDNGDQKLWRFEHNGDFNSAGDVSTSSGKYLNNSVQISELVGEVAFFARTTPPSGWLKANGAAVSRTTYAALFAAIGTTFGAGDGSSTFNLPDLRGEFVRGLDDGRNVDGGRRLGTNQGDAIRNITGAFDTSKGSWAQQFVDFAETSGAFDLIKGNKQWTGDPNNGGNNLPTGFKFDASRVVPTANENRPRNIALLACIKY
ncbi:tail fiber protein [Haemophilus influenzae]|nr:tail fiber protein [Haemophilus influenzae]MCK9130633.1 tail fiber protein [Haemophilus influenzae]MCK9135875.1 tail fiber protein [Haemophilus influenzae]MCK9141522.1 tail fiber protein [Haemophilus influenzae]